MCFFLGSWVQFCFFIYFLLVLLVSIINYSIKNIETLFIPLEGKLPTIDEINFNNISYLKISFFLTKEHLS